MGQIMNNYVGGLTLVDLMTFSNRLSNAQHLRPTKLKIRELLDELVDTNLEALIEYKWTLDDRTSYAPCHSLLLLTMSSETLTKMRARLVAAKIGTPSHVSYKLFLVIEHIDGVLADRNYGVFEVLKTNV
jgi:hypothetical protein